jgi:RNA polymerase sigma-70 factor, ECF subfamily
VIEQPDATILRKARRGDERAFAVIVRQYESRLFSYILRSVQDWALAEELMQDVLLRVYRALPGFTGESFTSWLFEIAKNRVIDEHRLRVRHPRAIVPLDAAATAETVDGNLGVREPLERIWAAIAELRLDLQTPLLLREIAGMSYAEIADMLGLSLPTVRWRIFLARQQLLELLRNSDGDETFRGRADPPAQPRVRRAETRVVMIASAADPQG